MTEKERRESMSRDIAKAVEGMPEGLVNAIAWAMGHMNIIEEMCKDTEMTRQEIEKHIERAKAEKDYMKLVLVCFARYYMDKG